MLSLFMFVFVCVCFVICLFYYGMREGWRTLGMYCHKIEYLDWDASCSVLRNIRIMLCGKQASYRPVSTTVGDHVGIPVAELLFFFVFFCWCLTNWRGMSCVTSAIARRMPIV